MAFTCKVTPTQAATGVTLHIVPKGSSDDCFCTDGTYTPDTSDCEAGEWKWGSLVVGVPDIIAPHVLFNGITTMQEMTPQICADALENDTVRLQDTRDGKYYWVAKLADGNCWMTQNLDLNLDTAGTLTPENSDVSAEWNFNSAGGSWYTLPTEGDLIDDFAIQAWDLGEYVKTSPIAITGCDDITTNLGACPDQFTDVSSMAPMTEAINEGKLPSENISIQRSQYDAHFLVGNYYSWGAATAGSGNNVSDSGDATSSICPNNWHLPPYSGNGSYQNLLSSYGHAGSSTSGNNNINTSPLYFVRSGEVDAGFALAIAGNTGSYWSGRASDDKSAYYLYINKSQVVFSDYYRTTGYSVRCVAAG